MYSFPGFCPCCEEAVTFKSRDVWYRDNLRCPNCDSLVRERALMLVLNEIVPNWRTLRIHESSPADRGISKKIRQESSTYLATQFYPKQERGSIIGAYRNENLENQTFEDGIFDLVLSLDVMEHVFDPAKAYREISRTLSKRGYYIHTFPIRKWQTDPFIMRASLDEENKVKFLVEPPEYHGNPIDESGSLVTIDYGYDIARQISEWSGFDVRISRFWDKSHGIFGEYTEVVICRKPA